MKQLLTRVLVLFIYTNLQAEIHSANHPKGEPKGLYLIILKESLNGTDVFKDYRLYCPTLTIREVTGGKKRPSHKVKDILEFHDSNFYNDIKTVCANKKPKVKTPVVNSSTQNSSNIVIEDMSEDGETAKVMLRDDSSYCMLHIKNENYITQTNCVRLTNSKHIKIICTKKKKLCKTEQEIFDFMDKEFRSASNAMKDYQAGITKEEMLIEEAREEKERIEEPPTNSEIKDVAPIDVKEVQDDDPLGIKSYFGLNAPSLLVEQVVGFNGLNGTAFPKVLITSKEDSLTIKKVKINKGNCKFTNIQTVVRNRRMDFIKLIPKTLKYGEFIEIRLKKSCKLLRVDIETNIGDVTFSF